MPSCVGGGIKSTAFGTSAHTLSQCVVSTVNYSDSLYSAVSKKIIVHENPVLINATSAVRLRNMFH